MRQNLAHIIFIAKNQCDRKIQNVVLHSRRYRKPASHSRRSYRILKQQKNTQQRPVFQVIDCTGTYNQTHTQQIEYTQKLILRKTDLVRKTYKRKKTHKSKTKKPALTTDVQAVPPTRSSLF